MRPQEQSVNWRKLRTALLTLLVLCIIPLTRYYQIDQPLIEKFKQPHEADPFSLQVSGEFVESNLGTEQDGDGSVTVRMIGQQYLFIPHCVVVPAGVPVHLRITSADAVHSLAIDGTDYKVKVLPGTISKATLQFNQAGIHKTLCGEFCGPGHYDMRSEIRVLAKPEFPVLGPNERGYCAAP
jgi:cytochrome c oxidase subunit II